LLPFVFAFCDTCDVSTLNSTVSQASCTLLLVSQWGVAQSWVAIALPKEVTKIHIFLSESSFSEK